MGCAIAHQMMARWRRLGLPGLRWGLLDAEGKVVQEPEAAEDAVPLKRLLEVAARFVCPRPVLNLSEEEKFMCVRLAWKQLKSMGGDVQFVSVAIPINGLGSLGGRRH